MGMTKVITKTAAKIVFDPTGEFFTDIPLLHEILYHPSYDTGIIILLSIPGDPNPGGHRQMWGLLGRPGYGPKVLGPKKED
jgi:hypothetical protein